MNSLDGKHLAGLVELLWKYFDQFAGIENHGSDGTLRLASSKNVQWSAEDDTICLHSRTQNHVISCPRSRNFDERTKKMNEKFDLGEMKNVFLAETRKFHYRNLDFKKTRPHHCPTF